MGGQTAQQCNGSIMSSHCMPSCQSAEAYERLAVKAKRRRRDAWSEYLKPTVVSGFNEPVFDSVDYSRAHVHHTKQRAIQSVCNLSLQYKHELIDVVRSAYSSSSQARTSIVDISSAIKTSQ